MDAMVQIRSSESASIRANAGYMGCVFRSEGTDSTRPNRQIVSNIAIGLLRWQASVVLLVGMAGWLALRYSKVQVLDTAVGEQRRITLADGSVSI